MRLADKRALVTGAQQGIGRATVLALAREGADVAINWLDDRPAADRLAEEVEAMDARPSLSKETFLIARKSIGWFHPPTLRSAGSTFW